MAVSDGDMDPPDTAGNSHALDPLLKSDVRLLQYQVGQLDKKLDRFFDEVKNNYASKGDLQGVKDDVHDLKSNISWVIKIIVGAVLAGLLGLVIMKGGGPIR